jgi:lysophospholipid acyltransferase (LPLAT)-like uncharacterized protein
VQPVRFAWLARLSGRAIAAYVRLVAATARASGTVVQDQVVFAIWHESNLAAMCAAWKLRDRRRVVSFSTRGFRGIVMNTMLAALDGGAVTLPDEGRQTRGEAARMSLELARVGRDGDSVVVSCDGPLGPYRVAKPGVLLVAREAGLPIQPWAVAIRPALRLHGRWDHQLVPLPFCRIRVEEGEQIRLAPREPLKPKLSDLQAALAVLAEQADRRMARGTRRP